MLDDVAHLHRPFALAGEVQADRFLLHVMRRSHHVQGPLQFIVEHGIEETHGLDLGHGDACHASFADDVQVIDVMNWSLPAGRFCTSMPMMVPV